MTETQVLKSGGDTAQEALLESCFCLNSNEVEPNCVPTFEPLLLFAVPQLSWHTSFASDDTHVRRRLNALLLASV